MEIQFQLDKTGGIPFYRQIIDRVKSGIATGQLEVTLAVGEKRKLSAGAFVGEIGLLKKTARTATVTATTRSILLFLERREFDELMRHHSRMRAVVESEAEDRLAELDAAQSAPES